MGLWDTATLDYPPLLAPLDFLPSPAQLDSLLSLNQLQQAMPAQLFQALLHQPLSPAQLPLEESGRERLSQSRRLMLDFLELTPLDLDTAALDSLPLLVQLDTALVSLPSPAHLSLPTPVQLSPMLLQLQSSPAQLLLEESGRERLRPSQRLTLPSLESTLLDTTTLDSLPLLAQLDTARLVSLLSPDLLDIATLDFLPTQAQLFLELLLHQSSPDQLVLEDLDSGKQPLEQSLNFFLSNLILYLVEKYFC